MSKVNPEIVLDANQLPDPTSVLQTDLTQPKQLPQHLIDFKKYVESKFCYFAKPVDNSEIVSVQPKVAYQCHMKILMESRILHTEVTAHPWQTGTVFGSSSLGRFFENTEQHGESVGNIWTDYDIPITNGEKEKRTLYLPNSASYYRCSSCRGKGNSTCWKCSRGLVENGTKVCPDCKGSEKVRCSRCKGLGGFRHLPTIKIKWYTRYSTWVYQNSFLHLKRIRKGNRTLTWSAKSVSWSEQSSIENLIQSVPDETPDIPLKANIIKDYYEKQLNPVKDSKHAMRRLDCSIEQMNFEEIHYMMGEQYVNKQDSSLEHTFRFCQYPGPKGKILIYENDYPLNCCGCFGEKVACYSSCCTIL